jgi:hypothetical protein
MVPLLVNFVALAVAPFLCRLSGRAPALEAGLDALLRVLVFGLVFGQVLPHGVALAGWPALVGAAIGVVLPQVLEFNQSYLREGEPDAPSPFALVAVLCALAAHSFLDGLALGEPGASALGVAVVLHTLPLGMIVWHGIAGRYGERSAIAALVTAGVSTALGFRALAVISTLAPGVFLTSGTDLLSGAPVMATALGVLPALVGGSLLHAVAHPWKPGIDEGRARGWSGFGAVLGAMVAAGVSLVDPAPILHTSELELGGALLAVASVTAPAVLLALIIGVGASWFGRTSAETFVWAPGAVLVGAVLGPWVGAAVLGVGVSAAMRAREVEVAPSGSALILGFARRVLPWWGVGVVAGAGVEPWVTSMDTALWPYGVAVAIVVAWFGPGELPGIACVAAVLAHKSLPAPITAAWCVALAARHAWRSAPLAAVCGVAVALMVQVAGAKSGLALHAFATLRPFSVACVAILVIGVIALVIREGLTEFISPVTHPRG